MLRVLFQFLLSTDALGHANFCGFKRSILVFVDGKAKEIKQEMRPLKWIVSNIIEQSLTRSFFDSAALQTSTILSSTHSSENLLKAADPLSHALSGR